jgi:uncharacterized membrane protein
MSDDTELPSGSVFAKHLRTRLVSGLLVLIPLAITLFILNVFFSSLTAFVRPLLRPILGGMPEIVLTLVALSCTVFLVYLVGLVATHIIGRRIIQVGEDLLLRLPLVRSVYAASKQVVDTFSSSTKAAFQAVVLVEFPHKDSLALGFVTGTILNPEGKLLYRVFVATTPNPTSGFLLLLPQEDIRFTDVSVEDGVKMIVSGGMLAPKSYQIKAAPAQSAEALPEKLGLNTFG